MRKTRRSADWQPGDIAECAVDFFWYAPQGFRDNVLGPPTRPGRRGHAKKKPPDPRGSAYFDTHFINLSRSAPLLDTGHTFGAPKEPKMAVRKTHIVIRFNDGEPTPDNIAAALHAGNAATPCDGYQDALQVANNYASGGSKALVLCAVAVVEPVPNTRVRQL